MSIFPIVSVVLLTSGVCMGATMLAYAKMPARRIREEKGRKLKGPAFVARLLVTAVFSMALVLGSTHLLSPWLFHERPVSVWRGLFEIVAILAVYDLMYYFMHRYLFHKWSWLQRVHAVHHRARHPIAIDSLFLHPVENLLGLSLLFLATWAIGPVNVYVFGVCFFVYSWLNIIVHAGVDLPVPYLGYLAKKHAIHHVDMKSGNYASLSPIYDMIFGTSE